MNFKLLIMNIRAVLIFSIFLFIFSCTPSKNYLLKNNFKKIVDSRYIRVLLLKTGNSINISSDSRIKITDKKNNNIRFNRKSLDIIFYPDKILNPITIESWGSYIKLNDKPYRGMLEIHKVLGKLYVINRLRIYEYLFSVVASEIPSSWNIEALKAQAIAARTYTFYHLLKKKKRDLYNLDATTNFQVYKGLSAEKASTTNAVIKTSGIIITYKYEPIISYFHSTCGGRTADDRFVWKNNDLKYLSGVRCSYCKKSTSYSWTTELSIHEIKKYLQRKYKRVGKIKRISFKKVEGRITKVRIIHQNGIIKISGNAFRLLFPSKRLKSLYFNARKTKYGLKITGHGWGHGVGLCQWGANGMAQKGANYRSILKYYFKGIKIIKADKRYIAKKIMQSRASYN